MPPEAISWNDADDNNAFHEKLIVMDLDGSISTELAMIKDKKAYYEEMKTIGLPLGEDGKQMPAPVGCGGLFIPKGTKNLEVAKDFSRFFMQPEVLNTNLKGGLGRTVPSMPQHREGGPLVARSERPPPGALYGRIGAGTHHRAATTPTIRHGAR